MNRPDSSPFRILAAAFYDALTLLAVLFVAGIPWTLVMGPGFEQHPMSELAWQLYLLAIAYAFFAWFHVQGHPTLGEKAWGLCLRRTDGGPVDWYHYNRRFAAVLLSLATLGLGWLWVFFGGQTLHDRLAGTRITACTTESH